jgi:hypothetical protein
MSMRNAGLHAEGHFVLADAGGDLRIADVIEGELVEVLDGIDDELALGAGDAMRVGEKVHRVALGTEFDALVDGGQEPAAPGAVARSENLSGDEGDEGGEVLAFAAEPVADPGTDTGTAEAGEAGEGEKLGGGVVELVGVERLDETQLVGDALQVGKEVGYLDAGFPAAFEGELVILGRPEEVGLFADEGELLALEKLVGAEFTAAFLELRFEIEEVEVGRGSNEVDVDDALGPGGVVEPEFGEGIALRAEGVLLKKGAEGGTAEAKTGALEEEAAGGLERGHEFGMLIVDARRDRGYPPGANDDEDRVPLYCDHRRGAGWTRHS